jgi:GrpB-like predicted nucleotidyltransferase (UPF0157 family)
LDLEEHREAQRQRAEAAGWRESGNRDEPMDLSPYDARWPAYFFDEAKRLAEILGTSLAAVEHIGSTAVPCVAAKPIVDIIAGLLGPITSEQRDALELGGYEPRGDADRFYLRGDKNYDLYVCVYGSREWIDALALRDFLRAHPPVAQDFAEHKRRTIAAGARTSTAYHERKAPILTRLLDRARAWAAATVSSRS